MKEHNINVLIADQHPKVRSALMRSISKIYPQAVFIESENGASSLLILTKKQIHLTIIDENIPILSGIEVIEKYYNSGTATSDFILISAKHNFNNYQKGIKLGVNVFIDKSHADQEIKYGIRAIQNGTRFLCGCLTEEISIINRFASKISNLSTNERMFLGQLKEGKSIQEISDKLVISNKSVNQITSNICAVINIPADKEKLTNWAINHKHYFN